MRDISTPENFEPMHNAPFKQASEILVFEKSFTMMSISTQISESSQIKICNFELQ
jgi:hypothetical protein